MENEKCPICNDGETIQLRVEIDEKVYAECPLCTKSGMSIRQRLDQIAIMAYRAGYRRACDDIGHYITSRAKAQYEEAKYGTDT